MVGLGDLPGGDFDSLAVDVSADGSAVVGTSSTNAFSGSEAFYWTQSMGMVNLRDLLISQGVGNLAGWTLHGPVGISDDGLTITGQGFGPRGREAWVATIPEPTIFALAGVAACTCLITRAFLRCRFSRRIA
jgi:hypothetical protein